MTISCLQGGQAIVLLSKETKTNLEIQKILYFANMLYIGENRNEKPLVENKFLTWRFGPVVEKLYDHIKERGDERIPLGAFIGLEAIMDGEGIPTKEKYEKEAEAIYKAYKRFGKYSPYQLVRISHWSKGAWRAAIKRGQKEIDNVLILDEFDARNQ